jgi:hypothetical protein
MNVQNTRLATVAIIAQYVDQKSKLFTRFVVFIKYYAINIFFSLHENVHLIIYTGSKGHVFFCLIAGSRVFGVREAWCATVSKSPSHLLVTFEIPHTWSVDFNQASIIGASPSGNIYVRLASLNLISGRFKTSDAVYLPLRPIRFITNV